MAYPQSAGEEAQVLYAPCEALVHFTHALDAAHQQSVVQQLSFLRGRAQSYEILGEFDRAWADYEAAFELAGRGTNRVDEWRALIDLGFLWQSRNLEQADEYYQRALALAHAIGDASILAQMLNRVGTWSFNRRRPREALLYEDTAPFFLKSGAEFFYMVPIENIHGCPEVFAKSSLYDDVKIFVLQEVRYGTVGEA